MSLVDLTLYYVDATFVLQFLASPGRKTCFELPWLPTCYAHTAQVPRPRIDSFEVEMTQILHTWFEAGMRIIRATARLLKREHTMLEVDVTTYGLKEALRMMVESCDLRSQSLCKNWLAAETQCGVFRRLGNCIGIRDCTVQSIAIRYVWVKTQPSVFQENDSWMTGFGSQNRPGSILKTCVMTPSVGHAQSKLLLMYTKQKGHLLACFPVCSMRYVSRISKEQACSVASRSRASASKVATQTHPVVTSSNAHP